MDEYKRDDTGCLVVVTLPNGTMYPFEITSFGDSLETIKKTIVSKYGNVQIRIYPKGSVLIGKKVILP